MPFWAFYRVGSYDASLLTVLGFTIKVTIVHVKILRLSHLMSQLISSYVFYMILAKFIELRKHLLIFDYS